MQLGLFVLTAEPSVSFEGKGLAEKATKETEGKNERFDEVMNELIARPDLATQCSTTTFFSQLPALKCCGGAPNAVSVEEIKPITNCPLSGNPCSIVQTAFQKSNVGDVAIEPFGVFDFESAVSEFLDEVQSINFSIDMGDLGKVELSGGKNKDGEFQFQVSGSKEALGRLLGSLLKAIASFAASTVGTSIGGEGCSALESSNSCLDNSCVQDCPLEPQLENPVVSEGSEQPPILQNSVGSLSQETEANFSEEGVVLPIEEISLSQIESESLNSESNSSFEVSSEQSTASREEAISDQNFKDVVLSFEQKSDRLDGLVKAIDYPEVSTEQKPSVNDQEKGFTSGEDPLVVNSNYPKTGEVFSGEAVEVSLRSGVDVEELFDRIFQVLSTRRGEKQVTIQLEPKELGKIVVSLTEHNDKIRCVWHVENPRARELVESNLALLEARAASQGMNLESFVNQENYSFGSGEQFIDFTNFGFQRNYDKRSYQKDFPTYSWSEGKLNLIV